MRKQRTGCKKGAVDWGLTTRKLESRGIFVSVCDLIMSDDPWWTSQLQVRAHAMIEAWCSANDMNFETLSPLEFCQRVSRLELLKSKNMGRKTVGAMVRSLHKRGYFLNDECRECGRPFHGGSMPIKGNRLKDRLLKGGTL